MVEATPMAHVAKEYCELIEHLDQHRDVWLARLIELLPRLHAAVVGLGQPSEDAGRTVTPDLDARFELFSRVRQVLGDSDPYWLEFDVAADGQQMSGSLADDLTDIYCELKYGLTLLDSRPGDPGPALNGWREGFKRHWGQHLVDAERHLYALRARE